MSVRLLNWRYALAASGITAASVAAAHSGISAQEATPDATPVGGGDLPLEQIALLTGSDPLSINITDEEYGIHDTDLGSTFLYNDQLYIVFGDTFGPGGGDWSSNVLAISTDDDPSDGITIDRFIED